MPSLRACKGSKRAKRPEHGGVRAGNSSLLVHAGRRKPDVEDGVGRFANRACPGIGFPSCAGRTGLGDGYF